jgi:hypothetical protein
MPGTANGGGSNARFWEPMGLTWDGANLYVADSVNDTLREIDVASTSVGLFIADEAENVILVEH